MEDSDWNALAPGIRERLGAEERLLDAYIAQVLVPGATWTGPAPMDRGIAEGIRLHTLCGCAVTGAAPGKQDGDPCFPLVCTYVSVNPLPYKSQDTRAALYFCHLFDAYSAYCAQRYGRELEADNEENWQREAELRSRLEAVIGRQELQRFRRSLDKAMERYYPDYTYWLGLIGENMQIHTTRDPESGLSIFELWRKDPRQCGDNWSDLLLPPQIYQQDKT